MDSLLRHGLLRPLAFLFRRLHGGLVLVDDALALADQLGFGLGGRLLGVVARGFIRTGLSRRVVGRVVLVGIGSVIVIGGRSGRTGGGGGPPPPPPPPSG